MEYDIIILGGGAAGLTAAMYAARGGAKTLVLEKMMPGGQTGQILEIENYPGFLKVSGTELAAAMLSQATAAGADIVYAEPKTVDLESEEKSVSTDTERYTAKAVILATGAVPKKIGVKNEGKLTGQGVSYCATCDGAFFKGKDVAVVGNGNHALTDALYLKDICKTVTIINRKPSFQASPNLVEKVENSQIEILANTALQSINGEPVSSVTLKNTESGEICEKPLEGVFIAAGRTPDTLSLPEKILDEKGFIATDAEMKTSIEGVFAAGDVRKKQLRQIVTAAADGAIAAETAISYLKSHFST